MKKLFFIPAVAAMMFLASCGGGDTDTTDTTTTTETTTDETPADEAPGADIPGINDVQVSNTIELTGNDNMKYDKTLFKVKAGQEVTLKFTNVGSLPKDAMGHNVVVLQQGTDVEKLAMDALKAKENDYIPSGHEGDIIAHTKLLGPGESDTITFTIDEPGVYEFICTFPGHHGTMNGKIVVEQ